MRILGLEVSGKTDFLAFTAFLLSLCGIIYQTFVFVRGADVKLYPPLKLFILTYPDHNDDDPERRTVMLNSTMTYVNKGQIGYNAVIKRESVKLRIADEVYDLEWMNFESYVPEGLEESKPEGESVTLKRDYKDDAHPVPVNGGSSESHQTSFIPFPVRGESVEDRERNFIDAYKFIEMIYDIDKIELEFTAEIYGEKTEHAVCWIELNDTIRHNFEDNLYVKVQCVHQ